MRKLIILLFAVLAVNILNAQTLRMTTVHIDEQKEIKALNNHIIAGFGYCPIEDHYDGSYLSSICGMISYYRTDVLLNNTLGFYGLLSYGEIAAQGVIAGVTYKVLDKNPEKRLFVTGGLGFGRYLYIGKYDEYFTPSFRVESGILYCYNRIDIKVTAGYPDFFSLGMGFNF